MIARLAAHLDRLASRFVPEPFVLALALTALVMGLAGARVGWGGVLDGWARGFADPAGLAFALQMCLVLVTGHALALSPAVRRGVGALARWPQGPAQAAALVGAVSVSAGLLHWGLGAVVGALLAREVGRSAVARGVPVHYPLLGAAAYAGMAVWHGGLSGSAPLKAAEAGGFTERLVGVVPVAETLFSPMNGIISGLLAVSLPLLFAGMAPSAGGVPPPERPLENIVPSALVVDRTSVWSGLQDGPWGGRCVGGLGLALAGLGLSSGRLAFDLNAVNLLFLCAGLALMGSLRAYLDAVSEGARGAGAIIVQFPLYFGILGVMKAGGLIERVSDSLVAVSTPTTFPVLAFWSAGLVNLVVPSGGGQWALQAELLLRAGEAHGVAPATTVLAFAYGDAWTNLLQPFWALPLLAIMGLRARDIVGYTAIACLWMGLLVSGGLLLLGGR